MTLTIDLPADVAQSLAADAAVLQIPLETYALQLLASRVQQVHNVRTGKDLVHYWQREGLIGTRSDIVDPLEHARKLRQDAERRTQG